VKDSLRIGLGYDAHPLVKGEKLVLGGVSIPFKKGLSGWSDADVLTHAVMDALLGAAASTDKGRLFPPGDPKYKGISSLALLREVKDRLSAVGWAIINIDAVVIAAEPHLAEHISQMEVNISQTLDIEADQVSVKATTANGLGCAGRARGIAAHAVALLQRSQHEGI
jgi:2-C-methyl-D-erythritol 2,4-cyclodiphosphate synthase